MTGMVEWHLVLVLPTFIGCSEVERCISADTAISDLKDVFWFATFGVGDGDCDFEFVIRAIGKACVCVNFLTNRLTIVCRELTESFLVYWCYLRKSQQD